MAMALDTLAYARRLREAGFSEQQADGQAQALAAAMTDSLATRQDLRELEARVDARFLQVDARFAQVDARFDSLERHIDTRLAEFEKRVELRFEEQTRLAELRFEEQEIRTGIRFEEQDKRMGIRFGEQSARFGGDLANLERRMTLRLGGITVAGIGVVSVLVKLL